MSLSPPCAVTCDPLASNVHSQYLPGYLLGDNISQHHTSSAHSTPVSVHRSPGSKSSQLTSFSGCEANTTWLSPAHSRPAGPPVRGLLSSSTAASPTLQNSLTQCEVPSFSSFDCTSEDHPMTGLHGTTLLPRDNCWHQTRYAGASPLVESQFLSGDTSGSGASSDRNWITIFGFPPGAFNFILQQFSHYGSIVKHVRPSTDGNWMHVLYQSSLQAARALSKNGKVFGGQMMIGVTACTDKSVEDKENDGSLHSVPNQLSTQDGSRSLRSCSSPIRPLTVAYAASRSEYEVLKGKQVPRKDNSIVSKVKEYMFGW